MGFFQRLITGKQKSHAELNSQSGGLTGAQGYHGYHRRRGTAEALRTYETNPWVNAAVTVIGRDVAAVPWKLFKPMRKPVGKGTPLWMHQIKQKAPHDGGEKSLMHLIGSNEAQEVTQHPFLDLMEKPNSVMDKAFFMFVIEAQIDLAGECFLLIDNGKSGKPEALIPIPPHAVKKTPDGTYNKYDVQWGRVRREYTEDKIIHLKTPSPFNPYGRGVGMASSLASEIDTDENAAQFTAARFNNFALPSFLVGIEGAREQDLLAAKHKFIRDYQGAKKQFLTHWHSGKIQIENLTPNFDELQLIELRKFERNTILQNNQIPPEIIGIVENSNRSTIDAADYFYNKRVVVPRLEFIRSFLQDKLLPLFRDTQPLLVYYDSPVPEDREYNLAVMKAAPQSFQINEWRAAAGKPPIEGGCAFYEPTTYANAENNQDNPAQDTDTPEGSDAEENRRQDDIMVDNFVRAALRECGVYEMDSQGRDVINSEYFRGSQQ